MIEAMQHLSFIHEPHNIFATLLITVTFVPAYCGVIDHSYAERHRTPAPDFLHTPSNVTFHRGELAVLRCSVYNLGTKYVVWRRTDSSFPLTSGTMVVVADDRLQIGHVQYKNQWDLMIKNVQPEDAGIYECQVASKDKTVRRLVQLTVIDPEADIPEIKISEEQYVERGESIVLQCNATGEYYPPDEMDWFRNGQKVDSNMGSGIKILKQFSISKRTFSSNLRIDRAKMDDGGTYVCRTSSMQIASTKVHVLNGKNKAETYNRKRGTLKNGDETSDQISALHSAGYTVSSTYYFITLTMLTFWLSSI
ncbi:lachesin-like isoform X2 [Ruditapes philippinarum]|uniref:lachesin-like isoform X2 n=1 Tax=Ruditapes philippinarum TaxID=129788 RepID=UPI00295C1967|nr:lachesin-like isoform X2 [Ruditapes philippinarum]